MRKQTVQYTSPLDALIAVAKRLSKRELRHGMESKDFFAQYMQGGMPDDAVFVEWANDYRHYLALRTARGERVIIEREEFPLEG